MPISGYVAGGASEALEEVLDRRLKEQIRQQQEKEHADQVAIQRKQIDLQQRRDEAMDLERQKDREWRTEQGDIATAGRALQRATPGEITPELAAAIGKDPANVGMLSKRRVIDAHPVANLQSVLPGSVEPQAAGGVSGPTLQTDDKPMPRMIESLMPRGTTPAAVAGGVSTTTDTSGPQDINVLAPTPEQAKEAKAKSDLADIGEQLRRAPDQAAKMVIAADAYKRGLTVPQHLLEPSETEKQKTEAMKLKELRTYQEMIYQKHFGQEQGALNERARMARENKPITAFQGEAVKFYGRMKDQIAILNNWEDKITNKDIAIINAAPNWAQIFTNPLLSEAGQNYANALKIYTEARLRDDSGAAVPTSEYINDRLMVARQIGDGPEVLSQRRRAREVAADVLAFEAGPAYEDYFGKPFVPLPIREAQEKAKTDGAPKTPTTPDPKIPVQRKVVTIDGESVVAVSYDGGKSWKKGK